MTKEPKQWITVNGVHVPIFEGDTKEDAIRRAITGKDPHRKPESLEDTPYNKLTVDQKIELARKTLAKNPNDKYAKHLLDSAIAEKNEQIKAEQIKKNKEQADKLNGKTESSLVTALKKMKEKEEAEKPENNETYTKGNTTYYVTNDGKDYYLHMDYKGTNLQTREKYKISYAKDDDKAKIYVKTLRQNVDLKSEPEILKLLQNKRKK